MNKTPPQLFDRKLWQTRRARHTHRLGDHLFLHQRALDDIVDRLETVNRNFDHALVYGAGSLANDILPAKIKTVLNADIVAERLSDLPSHHDNIVFDEEKNPFTDKKDTQKFDLAISLLTLHHSNDFIGALTQYRQALKPDGFFVAAMFGGQTLSIIRQLFLLAESDVTGGAAQRIHPFADIKDIGQALSRAGFTMPVTDVDRVHVRYQNTKNLFMDLRILGETCILADRPPALQKEVVTRFFELYYSQLNEAEVLFEIIFLTGWAPHPEQPKPLKPGSATVSMATALTRK